MSIHLPDRPRRYGYGPTMPPGSISVQQLASGGFTLARVVGRDTWAPLTARENPAWLTWPSATAAAEWMGAAPPEDHPHWGAGPA